MPDIHVITFDLDNTLWDVTSVIISAERTMREWLDEQVPEFNPRFSREAMAQLRDQVVAAQPELAHDVSALRKAVLERAMRVLGLGYEEARSRAEAAFAVFFEARQRVVFFEGALSAIEELAGAYRLGALTNGNADVGRIGLDAYFSFAFSSADVGVSKPAPDMFQAALRHCRIDAREAIHVGDNLVDDILGAGSLGIHTIWTNHTRELAPEDAHTPSVTVEHLDELPAAVQRIQVG